MTTIKKIIDEMGGIDIPYIEFRNKSMTKRDENGKPWDYFTGSAAYRNGLIVSGDIEDYDLDYRCDEYKVMEAEMDSTNKSVKKGDKILIIWRYEAA